MPHGVCEMELVVLDRDEKNLRVSCPDFDYGQVGVVAWNLSVGGC